VKQITVVKFPVGVNVWHYCRLHSLHSTESFSWKCNITYFAADRDCQSESGKIKGLEKHHVSVLFLKQKSVTTIKQQLTELVMLESLSPHLLMW